MFTKPIAPHGKNIGRNCAAFWAKPKLTIRKLCHAAESNEKLFWKLVKSQRSSSQMIAFLVNGDLLTDKKAPRAMWADHFEALGTPSEIATFDKGFFTNVTDSVREVFSTFVNDPNGI